MWRILAIAVASALAACASTGPTGPTRAASASANAPATAAAASKNNTDGFGGYRRVEKHGEEYFCRREGVTGSRTQMIETCLTQAQLTAMRENSQELLRDVQNSVGASPGLGPDGSMPSQSAVPH
jgi:hypothetical protein